jgi:hypothetical protein
MRRLGGELAGVPELGGSFSDLSQLLQKIVARLDQQILPSSAARLSARSGWRNLGWSERFADTYC